MDIFEKHACQIAKDTLRLSDVGALILGGMTKEDARNFLRKLGWSDSKIEKFENS